MKQIILRKNILDERFQNDLNPKNLYKILMQMKQKAVITPLMNGDGYFDKLLQP
jgi:hypothetical protein